jgi:hypothetical protein
VRAQDLEPSDETLRLHDSPPGFEPERFAAHEQFFVEDVRRWAESGVGVALPPERMNVSQCSASPQVGSWPSLLASTSTCLRCGLLRLAWRRLQAAWRYPLPRTYLVAGTQEPFFLGNARTWVERAGPHGGAFWREEFPLMMAREFGP